MAKFVLILRETPAATAALSPAEMQACIEEYMAWSAKLAQAGRLIGGEKLMDEGGRRLKRQEGRLLVTDGPYTEAKDVIGGLFIIEAADYAEAEGLVADCPHLAIGEIELRQIHEL
ncbi:YciI family protein [Indioceanicola profundi]|uniref:YciI family protein n=1 Tax=Indioceanicola profundi TaxID=2220096 RepID=UPI000E6ABA66|nr:YciI family protein [Indioceanicola profundi]